MNDIAHPDPEAPRRVFAALGAYGITAALGGSTVLASRGLVARVRDWDVTTDADVSEVCAALDAAAIRYERKVPPDASYRADAYLSIVGAPIEIIVRHVVGTPDGDVAIPTVVGGSWLGLPIADPEGWILAYRAMGRTERSDMLRDAVAAEANP